MENERIYHLIGKKLSSDISGEELTELENFISENAENEKVYTDLEEKWILASRYHIDLKPDIQSSWEDLRSKINRKQSKQISLFPMAYRIAAILVLAIGLGYYFKLGQESPLISYTTAVGEQLTVTLPDNSTVWLNENSSLIVSDQFNVDARNVQLNGEGFFEISRDEGKPFIITNALTQVEVLGTSFNVEAYPEMPNVQVDVATGIVAFSEISEKEKRIILKKGMRGIFDKNSKSLESGISTNANFLSWKTKKLEFKDAALSQVVQDLEEYFGVKIKIANTDLNGCRFTSSFEDPSIEDVLEILTITLDISFKKVDAGYIIDGRGCTN